MALSDENIVMPVSPMYGNGNCGNGDLFGCNGAWIILLLLLGWGNNGGFGGGAGANGLYPWMNQANQMSDGFRAQELGNSLSDIKATLGDIALAQNNANITGLQRSFDAQTAVTAGLSGLQAQLAQCCCENRLATQGLQSVIQSENCADRQAISDGIRDILVSQNNGIQRILDQLCSDKIDAKNEKIADLERQLMMANLATSQNAQTSRILADNAAQTVALEQYLNPTPVPSYTVPNPNCCQRNTGCGCGF